VELLLQKPVVVALAILGALLSTLSAFLQRRQVLGERGARLLNYAGYGAMGVSIVLFVLAGLWGARG
jgi:hypothetical protein